MHDTTNRCTECKHEVDEFTARAEGWRHWSDGTSLLPFCPACVLLVEGQVERGQKLAQAEPRLVSKHDSNCRCPRCPGFQPGNEYAVGNPCTLDHGAKKRPHTLAKDPRTLDLVEAIREVVPVFHAADELAVQALAMVMVRAERAQAALEELDASLEAEGEGALEVYLEEGDRYERLRKDLRSWLSVAERYLSQTRNDAGLEGPARARHRARSSLHRHSRLRRHGERLLRDDEYITTRILEASDVAVLFLASKAIEDGGLLSASTPADRGLNTLGDVAGSLSRLRRNDVAYRQARRGASLESRLGGARNPDCPRRGSDALARCAHRARRGDPDAFLSHVSWATAALS